MILKRIAKSLKDVKDYGYVKNYGILCKLCGVLIKTKYKNRLTSNENYKEFTIHFDDGSMHETCLCEQCLDSLKDEHLELLYCLDMKEWWMNQENMNWDIIGYRRPESFTKQSRE